ncbi:hypothetical protein LPN04_31145 [Rugamonas sp. A1-17]|nr:hypothetical protein [Rugamonas sp. A1-17]
MNIIYRGSMPAPKHNHGDQIDVQGTTVEVQSREWTGTTWQYTCTVHGKSTILYQSE